MSSFFAQLFSCWSSTPDLTAVEQLEAKGVPIVPPSTSGSRTQTNVEISTNTSNPSSKGTSAKNTNINANPLHGNEVVQEHWEEWNDDLSDVGSVPKTGSTAAAPDEEIVVEESIEEVGRKVAEMKKKKDHELNDKTIKVETKAIAEEEEVDWFADMAPKVTPAKQLVIQAHEKFEKQTGSRSPQSSPVSLSKGQADANKRSLNLKAEEEDVNIDESAWGADDTDVLASEEADLPKGNSSSKREKTKEKRIQATRGVNKEEFGDV